MGQNGKCKGRKICTKKYSYVNLSWPALPLVYLPCPHKHLKTPVVDRKTIDREQHMNLLATPRGYIWDNPKDACNKICKPPCSDKKKPAYDCSPDRFQCNDNTMNDIWKCMTPDLCDKLMNIFVNDFNFSKTEAKEFIDEQKGSYKGKTSFCKCPCANGDADQNIWIKEFTELIGCKLKNQIALILCGWRTRRQKVIMELIINAINDISCECINISCPETRLHRALVVMADRLAVWLDKMYDNASKEAAGEESTTKKKDDDKDKEDEKKTRQEEKEKAKQEEEKAKQEEEKAKQEEEEKARQEEEEKPRQEEKEMVRQEEEAVEPQAEEREKEMEEDNIKQEPDKAKEDEKARQEAMEEAEKEAREKAENEAREKAENEAKEEAEKAEKEAEEKAKQQAEEEEAKQLAEEVAKQHAEEMAQQQVLDEAKHLEEVHRVEEPAVPPPPDTEYVEAPVVDKQPDEEAPAKLLPVEEELPFIHEDEPILIETTEEAIPESVKEIVEEKADKIEKKTSDPMDVIVDWIEDTQYAKSDRQKEIGKIVKTKLSSSLQGDPDAESLRPAIDTLGNKVSTWIDQLASEAEKEIKPLISLAKRFQAPKGVLYHVKRGSDNYYNVKQVSCDDLAEHKMKIKRAMNSDDIKDFTKWAEGLIRVSDAWTKWVENAFCEAYTMYSKNSNQPSELTIKEFQAWRERKRKEAIDWKKAQKSIFNKAQRWEEWARFTKNEIEDNYLCGGNIGYMD